SGVFHINFDSGLLDNAADHLAAGANKIADFVHRNLQRVKARRMSRDLRTGFWKSLNHFVEDKEPASACLLQRLAHDLRGDSSHLDVHLQSSDSFARSGNLEVHVTVVVLGACDVSENGVLIAFFHQSHGYTSYRRNQGNAR